MSRGRSRDDQRRRSRRAAAVVPRLPVVHRAGDVRRQRRRAGAPRRPSPGRPTRAPPAGRSAAGRRPRNGRSRRRPPAGRPADARRPRAQAPAACRVSPATGSRSRRGGAGLRRRRASPPRYHRPTGTCAASGPAPAAWSAWPWVRITASSRQAPCRRSQGTTSRVTGAPCAQASPASMSSVQPSGSRTKRAVALPDVALAPRARRRGRARVSQAAAAVSARPRPATTHGPPPACAAAAGRASDHGQGRRQQRGRRRRAPARIPAGRSRRSRRAARAAASRPLPSNRR